MLRFILEIEVHVSRVIESNGENYVTGNGVGTVCDDFDNRQLGAF